MTTHMVVNRGDLAEVIVTTEGEVHMTFICYNFPTPDLADAAFKEMTAKHPGWPLARVDRDD